MPDQMPPQAQPQPQQPDQDEQGGLQNLVEGIHTDLMELVDKVGQVDPQVAQKFDAVAQSFQAAVSELLNGGGGQPAEAGPKGPMQGGPGAVPM